MAKSGRAFPPYLHTFTPSHPLFHVEPHSHKTRQLLRLTTTERHHFCHNFKTQHVTLSAVAALDILNCCQPAAQTPFEASNQPAYKHT